MGKMRFELLLLLLALSGCLGSGGRDSQALWEVRNMCDKGYHGDSDGSMVIGAFACAKGYRLVFDDPDHADYYLTEKAEYLASCPRTGGSGECRELFEKCDFVNICRSV
jgi:hypothetical protein